MCFRNKNEILNNSTYIGSYKFKMLFFSGNIRPVIPKIYNLNVYQYILLF